MISYLKGKYIDRTDDGSIILNVNGIGFEVFVTGEVLGKAAFNNTEDIELYTYMQVKEDGMSLFGFLTLDELSIFKKIISVSGIGPKGGMSILSTLNREQFIMAVIDEDSDRIAKAPGIGKKTAAKLAGEGEAEYMKTLSEAYNTPEKSEFYNFMRSLDAFEESLGRVKRQSSWTRIQSLQGCSTATIDAGLLNTGPQGGNEKGLLITAVLFCIGYMEKSLELY